MCSIRNRARTTVLSRIHLPYMALPCANLLAALAVASEAVTIEMPNEMLDLDTGTVSNSVGMDPTAPTGADVQMAYNADRVPHAVVIPVGDGVELAFIAGVGFDGISSSDIPSLTFSSEPPDLLFSADDCVVVRTDQGTFFKLGNATETGLSITFNYEAL